MAARDGRGMPYGEYYTNGDVDHASEWALYLATVGKEQGLSADEPFPDPADPNEIQHRNVVAQAQKDYEKAATAHRERLNVALDVQRRARERGDVFVNPEATAPVREAMASYNVHGTSDPTKYETPPQTQYIHAARNLPAGTPVPEYEEEQMARTSYTPVVGEGVGPPSQAPGEPASSIIDIPGLSAGPCPWAKVAYPSLAAAQSASGKTARMATIQTPAMNDGASTAYERSGQWMVAYCRGNIDFAAADKPVVGPVTPLAGSAGTLPPPPPPPGATVPDPMGCGPVGPTAPRTITQRRCPPGMRLAKNDMCYPEKTLPKEWWKHDPKPAKVSYSEWEGLKKAKRTLKKVDTVKATADEITGRKEIESARTAAANARRKVRLLEGS